MASSSSPRPVPPLVGEPPGRTGQVVSLRELKTHCSTCSMRELCLPVGLSGDDLKAVDAAVGNRSRLRKGESLYRAGDPFQALFAVRLGTLKTTVLAEDGREQVAGYHLQGDLIGLDGLGTERHGCAAVALEDSDPPEPTLGPFGMAERLNWLPWKKRTTNTSSQCVSVARS